jgi:glycerophosphoryl diester phosphodiesterase
MKLLGHRGARNEAPENTLRGIEVALRAGADGIEVDVHLSRDGRVMVIHDDTVDRTCAGAKGRVAELTFDELRALDAGQGERIPTLDEVLDLARGKLEVFVELKGQGCETDVVRAIRARGQQDGCLLKAFDHRQVLRAKELAPDIRTACLLVARPVDPAGLARSARADGLSINLAYVDADLASACHAAGLLLCGWNCNRVDELARWRGMGLDWLGTDAPTTIVPAARRLG